MGALASSGGRREATAAGPSRALLVCSASSGAEAGAAAAPPTRLWISALAGAGAGMVSRLVVAPLDLIKIRLQVQLEPVSGRGRGGKYSGFNQALRSIVKEEGVRGLWKGNLAAQFLVMPYCAVQFMVKQRLAESAAQFDLNSKLPAAVISVGSGAVAGVAATLCSYPLDLLRTTLAAQGEPKLYAGLLDAARGTVRNYGIVGLYAGIGPTLMQIVPSAAIQFGVYDQCLLLCKRWNATFRSGSSGRDLTAAEDMAVTGVQSFGCGLVAGTASKLFVHPLDVAKKRFQVAGLRRHAKYGQHITRVKYTSLLNCLHIIWMEEGVRGLYKGLTPSLIKAAPAAAITFASFELLFSVLKHI